MKMRAGPPFSPSWSPLILTRHTGPPPAIPTHSGVMNARTRLLSAALAVGFLTQPTVGLFDRAYRSLLSAPKCDNAVRATEAEWEGTGRVAGVGALSRTPGGQSHANGGRMA